MNNVAFYSNRADAESNARYVHCGVAVYVAPNYTKVYGVIRPGWYISVGRRMATLDMIERRKQEVVEHDTKVAEDATFYDPDYCPPPSNYVRHP